MAVFLGLKASLRFRGLNKLAALLLLGVLPLAISACQGLKTHHTDPPKAPRIFRINITTEPPDLDPIKVTDLTSYNVVINLMRGLVQFQPGQFQPGQTIIPAIAQRWEVSPDGLRYTFHLRANARWSDGKAVTAQDFVDGWQRALSPKNGSEYAFFLYEIKNGKDYYDGKLRDFHQVGVQAPDSQTLVVQLERPVAYFLALMASPVALPARTDIIQRYGDKWTEAGHYPSNGPYVLQAWRHEERLRLAPNPMFYGEKPKVDAVEMVMVNDPNTSVVMYENNELDYIETPSSIPSFDVRRLRTRPDYHTGLLHAIYYFGFNTQKPPFNNPKVRQAFAYALDRSYFPRLLQSGQLPFQSWIPPGLVGANNQIGLGYNPAKARKLLAEAGYPGGKGFPTVTLGYRTMYDIQKEAEIAQFLWRQNLGVRVKLENMEWKVFLNRLKNDTPNLFRLNWYADYPDADTFMSLFISASGNNNTHWTRKAYDDRVARAAITRDPQARQALYDAAQRLLLEEDTAIIPIYIGEKGYLVKPHIRGVAVNELNLLNLEHLSVIDLGLTQKTSVIPTAGRDPLSRTPGARHYQP